MITRNSRQVWGLAMADIADERILSLCMVFAIGAILAPLFILLGLKHGVIGNLLDQLRNDPENREIRPETLLRQTVDDDWFDELRLKPEVAFVTPSLRGLGMRVDITHVATGQLLESNAAPSMEGDPLLLENGATPPAGMTVTLSQSVADKLTANVGEKVRISVVRRYRGQLEHADAEFEIAGIAAPRATMAERVWLPFQFLRDVETYLAGGSVPRLNWPGVVAAISPRFDGLVTVTENSITEEDLPALTVGTGFYEHEPWTPELLGTKTGRTAATGEGHVLYWRAIGNTVGGSNIEQLEAKFLEHGYEMRLKLPWVDGALLNLTGEDGASKERLRLVCRVAAPDADESPDAGAEDALPGLSDADLTVILNETDAAGFGETAVLRPILEQSDLEIPVRVVGDPALESGVASIQAELAGMLNEARQREVAYDPKARRFLPVEHGYRDFRLYARDIDDVAGLVEKFELQGIPVLSSKEAILRIRTMERYLTQLYLLVAAVAAVAGALSVAASLYANVERKKSELAYLRLIGFSRSSLAGFPAHQAFTLTLLAIAVAAGAYFLFKAGADHVFREQLLEGQSFCRLSQEHLFVAAGGLGIAAFAALVGAFAIFRIEVASCLRSE